MKIAGKISKYIFGNNRCTRNLYMLYVKKILAKLKSDEVGVICDYHLGETYLFCLMLDSFKAKNNIRKVVVISTEKYHQDIFEMFDDKIIRWYIYPSLQKRSFWDFREVKAGDIFYLHDRNDWTVQTLADRGLTYLQGFKMMVGLDPDTVIRHHENREMDNAKAKELFEKLNLTPGKTALVSPQASTIQNMDVKLCQDICDGLREKGYDIFLNVTGYGHHIRSVKSAFLPLKIAGYFCSLCGHVVALRSGFCDVISVSRAQFHILYPDQTYRDVFTVKDIMAFDSIKEYVMNEVSQKDLIEMLMNNIQPCCLSTERL